MSIDQRPVPKTTTATTPAELATNAVAPLIAGAAEATQLNKYHVQHGHGFAAEDANALIDRLQGRASDVIGMNNTLNGADRLVDGVLIQSKYCSTAQCSIDSAFDQSGLYRYSGQSLEVPKEQYAACVDLMRDRIASGQVPGVQDPEMAGQIVRAGHITYEQAKQIASAGTVEGVLFDMHTHAVSCAVSAGLSAVISVGVGTLQKKTIKQIAIGAIKSSMYSGVTTMATGVATSQFLRTKAGAVSRIAARNVVASVHQNKLGGKVVDAFARASLGRTVKQGAAINQTAKMLRSNVASSVISTAINTCPDFYRVLVKKNMSWTQCSKNFVSRGTSSAGGLIGGFIGMICGATIGSIVPVIGTVIWGVLGGIGGSLLGGWLAGSASKRVMDRYMQDDNWALLHNLPEIIAKISADHAFTEREIEQISCAAKRLVNAKFLRAWQAAKDPELFFQAAIGPYCAMIVKARSID